MRLSFACTCGFSMTASGKNPAPSFDAWKAAHLTVEGEHEETTPRKAAVARRKAYRLALVE